MPAPREPAIEWRPVLRARLSMLLPDATTATRRALEQSVRPRAAHRGDVLVGQGGEMQFVLLLDGHAAVRRGGREGKQLLLWVASAGELLCVNAVTFTDSPFDLVWLTDGTAATWRGELIRPLAAQDPGFCLALIDRAASIGMTLTGRIDALAFRDTRGRLAAACLEYRDLVFHERHPAISRTDLAALVGASREMVARCLRHFEERGYLKRIGRTGLVLLDEQGLRRYLEGA